MFARVFNTAKRILSRSPSAQRNLEELSEPTPRSADIDTEVEMVTTRRGTDVGPSVESTPQSSVRRGRGKRQMEIEETPTVSKRRRKSLEIKEQDLEKAEEVQEPVKESQMEEPMEEPQVKESMEEPQVEESDEDALDTIAVTIPDRTKEKSQTPSVGEKQPRRVHRSPRVIVPKKPTSPIFKDSLRGEEKQGKEPSATQEIVSHTPVTQQPNTVLETPAGQEVGEGSPTPKARASGQKAAKRDRKAKQQATSPTKDSLVSESRLPDEIPSSTWESEEADIATADPEPAPAQEPKKSHMRFGSEEPADAPGPITMNKRGHVRYSIGNKPQEEVTMDEPADEPQQVEEDDGSDSDEAPEMVTAASATSKVKAAEQDAVRARQAQQEKEERRQQQRAERIAREQAEKRKRDEKKANKLAKLQARQNRNLQRQASPTEEPLDVDMKNLPALLPDSILEAAGDRRPPTPPPVRPGKTAEEIRKEKLNRHIKFLERGEKPIKDLKKGSINVSVLAQQNALLAPKANRNTRNVREQWLKGRQQEKKGKKGMPKGQFRKMERRPVPGGFLKGGDD